MERIPTEPVSLQTPEFKNQAEEFLRKFGFDTATDSHAGAIQSTLGFFEFPEELNGLNFVKEDNGGSDPSKIDRHTQKVCAMLFHGTEGATSIFNDERATIILDFLDTDTVREDPLMELAGLLGLPVDRPRADVAKEVSDIGRCLEGDKENWSYLCTWRLGTDHRGRILATACGEEHRINSVMDFLGIFQEVHANYVAVIEAVENFAASAKKTAKAAASAFTKKIEEYDEQIMRRIVTLETIVAEFPFGVEDHEEKSVVVLPPEMAPTAQEIAASMGVDLAAPAAASTPDSSATVEAEDSPSDSDEEE